MVQSLTRRRVFVVGAGPNGLAAAVQLARQGHTVEVFEAAANVGGGCRSAELTLPGFMHDVCSAIHPFGIASPFFSQLPLGEHGLEWIHPSKPLAHPFDDGSAALVDRSIDATAADLGRDADAYRRVTSPLVRDWESVFQQLMGPVRIPDRPLPYLRFGLNAIRSAFSFARSNFQGEPARALLAGCAAHSMLPLTATATAGVGLSLLAAAHTGGWPLAKGGSQKISDALANYFMQLGGKIHLSRTVETMDDLSGADFAVFDTGPEQMADIAGSALPASFGRKLRRVKRNAGVFKLDLALDGTIPWSAPGCHDAGTVHLGGTLSEIARSESAVAAGQIPERPFVVLAQQSVFDADRAPAGKHTVWAYCHVPLGCDLDMTNAIEAQIERFAPGFKDRIIGRNIMNPGRLHEYNKNYPGGDITGGTLSGHRALFRPFIKLDPYSTPNPRLFMCSSSTPPGPGVHGMCGLHAAASVARGLKFSR